MASFYDVLIEVTKEYEENTEQAPINYAEMTVYQQYGTFLNHVPDEYQEIVAKNIVKIMQNYLYDEKMYTIHDEVNEELWEQNRSPLERKKNEFTNSIKADLTKAKNFRETLKNQSETFDGLPQNLIQEAINYGLDQTPYFKMVNLIDQYIDDLESRNFQMADKNRYLNSFSKPNRKELLDYLKNICYYFNIQGINASKELIKQLNNL